MASGSITSSDVIGWASDCRILDASPSVAALFAIIKPPFCLQLGPQYWHRSHRRERFVKQMLDQA
jgi:hypothetical protein